jgi:hypothetical protein
MRDAHKCSLKEGGIDENIKCFLEKHTEGTGKGTIACLIR